LRRHVTALMRHNIAFLQEINRDQSEVRTALGLFGRLRVETAPGPFQGQVDLKHGGLLPLVNAVRLLALREGIALTPTHARIAALREAGTLDADEAEDIAAAFRHISTLLLRQQIESLEAGRPVGNHVPPGRLSRRDKRLLVEAFRTAERLQKRVAGELTGDVLTGGTAPPPG